MREMALRADQLLTGDDLLVRCPDGTEGYVTVERIRPSADRLAVHTYCHVCEEGECHLPRSARVTVNGALHEDIMLDRYGRDR